MEFICCAAGESISLSRPGSHYLFAMHPAPAQRGEGLIHQNMLQQKSRQFKWDGLAKNAREMHSPSHVSILALSIITSLYCLSECLWGAQCVLGSGSCRHHRLWGLSLSFYSVQCGTGHCTAQYSEQCESEPLITANLSSGSYPPSPQLWHSHLARPHYTGWLGIARIFSVCSVRISCILCYCLFVSQSSLWQDGLV